MKGYMGELEMIVGGKGKDDRRASTHHQSRETGKKILPGRLESAPPKGKPPRKASPPDQKSKGEKPLDPRQVLPLEEGDFKSFLRVEEHRAA